MTTTPTSETPEGSTNVLLSIKPEFAEKILAGEKQYEFRKTRFSDPSEVDRVYMYASSPAQQVVGSFTTGEIVEADPESLWRQFEAESGIDERSRFLDYFSGKATGYAIEIDEVQSLSDPIDPYQREPDFRPPVSFQYLEGEPTFVTESCPQTASD